ncbi:MAG: cation diffusion facilitator family transporter [bacterium]
MSSTPAIRSGEHEKRRAALSSVIAAVGLTAIKLVAGLLTGSLGILAEAAHSALDLVAAAMTLFAVKISDKPADQHHPYGHGKVENLSALFETLLLLLTCGWIIYEAIHRLLYHSIEVQATSWAFIVMGISIVVDISRSRMLSRTAKKYHSQALEADALHFSTDVWSSSVVILGLVCVKAGSWFPKYSWLREADAVAALLVAAIVVYVAIRLGIRTIEALIDAAPPGLVEKITGMVESLPQVHDCHHVRIRRAGPQLFIDIHITVDGGQSLTEAHDLTEKVEKTIQAMLPESDITVHPEPDADQADNQSPRRP